MNEEALKYSFDLFVKDGYNGTIDDYKELIKTNDKARSVSYNLFTSDGYNGSDADFNNLMGIDNTIMLSDEELGKTNDSANVDPSVESKIAGSERSTISEDGSLVTMDPITTSSRGTELSNTFGYDFIKGLQKSEIKKDEKIKTGYAVGRAYAEGDAKGALSIAIEGIPAFAKTTKNLAYDMLMVDGADAAVTSLMEFVVASNEGREATPEEKAAIAKLSDNFLGIDKARKAGLKGDKYLDEYQTRFDNTITEELKKGTDADWGQIAGRIVRDAVGSAPYTVASMNKYSAALLGTAISVDKFEEEYRENPDKTLGSVLGNAITTGGIEMVDALISRKLLRGKGLLKGGSAKMAEKAVKQMNKGISRKALDILGIAGKEGLTEMGQSIATKINDEAWLGDEDTWATDAGSNIVRDMYSIMDEGIIGAFTGGGMASIATAAQGNKALKNRAEQLLKPEEVQKKEKEIITKIADNNSLKVQAEKEGKKSRAEALDKLIKKDYTDLVMLRNGNKAVLEKLEGKDLQDYAKNVDAIAGLKDGETNTEIENEIKRLQDVNRTLVEKAIGESIGEYESYDALISEAGKKFTDKEFQKYKQGATKLSKDLGFGYKRKPKTYKTTNGYINAVAKNENISFEEAKELVKNSDGVFLGEGVMLIDESVAKMTGAITAASHEILHPVFNAALGDANAQGEIVKEFKKAMTSKQKRFVRNKLKESGIPAEKWNTEYLTYFSDAILLNEINYDKNLFEKLKDVVLRVLKGAGFDNVSFDSGREVYNFLKEYNTSLKETGQVSEKAVEAIKAAEKKRTAELKKKNEKEKYKDSQIPASQQKITYEDGNGETNIAKVTTQLDGSRKIELLTEEGAVFSRETVSKDNTLTNEEYITRSTKGDIKTTEDVDIKTVINPKLKSRMSDRQRKAAGMGEIEVKAATIGRAGDIQKSVNQEILDLTDALDAAEDAYAADPNNPTLERNVELAEKALDEAEERAISGAPKPKVAAPKPKKEKKKPTKKEQKPVRTTNLAPQTAQDKKIMNTYNEGMKDTKRTSFTSSNPLPSKVENKLIPLFEGYINTLVQQKFKQYQSEALEFQDALAILRVEAVNALRTFNPARNQNLSGYVRRLIALRQPKMFEKANKEFTSSLDDVDVAGDAGVIRNFADEKQIAPDKLVKASKVITPKVRADLANMLKKWASQHNIDFDIFRFGDVDANATVKIDGKDVKVLNEVLKELFPGVDPEKFLDSRTMFTSGEASIVLGKLAENDQELIELFINLLPRGAVMPKGKNKAIVKDDNYGKSTKLDGSILKNFYDKGTERFTKKAGLTPFILKDNIRYSDVHKAFGMDSSGNKLNYQRAKSGIVLSSAYKMLGKLIMNEVIRTDLGLTAEQKMNVGAGKSDLQFSKNASVFEALNVEGTENFRNIFAHQSEKYRKAGQDLLIELAYRFTPEEVRDYILPLISDVDGSNYDKEARLLFRNKDDFFRKLKKYGKSKFGDYKPRQQRISVEGGAELKLAKVTSEYYQGASFIENIKAFVKNIKDRQTFAKEQQKGLLKIVKTLSEILDETSSKKGIGFDGKSFENISLGIFAYFNYLNTKNKNGILRTSAVPTQMAIIPSKDTPVKYIYEHTQTASDTSGELMQLIFNKFAKNQKFGKNPNIEKEFKEIMDGYTVALIPKIYDALLNTIAKENGDREGTKTRKDYIKKLLKPGKDGIPTRYKIPAFEKLLEENGLESLQNILTPIDQANYDAIVNGREAQFSINRVEVTETLNKANNNANNINAKPKGISVWDFDDTLAKTKSNVLYTMPDGTKGKLNAEEFAKKGDQMLKEGVEFDFSEFSKVVNGSKGPFFEKAMARNKKFGNKNVFILTARPANSANAIHEFLKGIGLDIPLANITGLADSSPKAKADWIVGKAAEGYNDFYFADDAIQNVKAVAKALEVLDVKSKVRQANVQFSKSMNSTFNQMIEKKSGIDARGTISKYKASVMGRKKGRFQFFIPPGAEDFEGLMYKLLDKGKLGEQQKEWFKKSLFDPFARGINEFDTYKLQVANAVRQLKKSLKDIPKELGKRDPKTDFKYEDAVRVYLWQLNGHEIKGISESDIKTLVDIVKNSPNLKRFARQLNKTMGGYPAPQESWLAGTITTDAINMVNTIKRKEFLETWQQNADIIFSEDNLNKLEAAFGEDYVEALKDSLYRMKSGRNRPVGANKLTNKFMNWVNDSVATIMFFNTRSALLQTLSTVNFINWGDNNPLLAAKAFSNQKQFWSDFSMLFNSDFLKSRRTGLKNDVNADEIANAAATQTNKAKAVLAVILKAGFLPTQIADSFAIAMGGASFYRNRVNTYMQKGEGKPGMGRLAAEEQAFLDFQEIAEATQQSSRPDRVSQQQASPLGRIILAFANTPMQYMRLTKKAFLDLKNGRGSAKENITKMLYYAAIQNVIFSSLQAALFATLFDDEEEEETKKKGVRVANTMLDSMLRGLGIYGAAASTVKNIVLEIDKQSKKDRPDYSEAALKALDLSPPISSKIRKGRSAGRAFSYKNTREKMVGFGLDNPAYYAIGQIASATANIPLDRAVRKANHVRLAFAQETKFWQSVSLLLGFSEWDLNMIEKDKKKTKFGEKMKWKKRKLKKRKLK